MVNYNDDTVPEIPHRPDLPLEKRQALATNILGEIQEILTFLQLKKKPEDVVHISFSPRGTGMSLNFFDESEEGKAVGAIYNKYMDWVLSHMPGNFSGTVGEA